jgi:hypothetical protein
MDPGSAAHRFALRGVRGTEKVYAHHDGETLIFPVIFRKQSRHRQSPPSTGIGRRAVSSAHQHVPDKSQLNSTPQPEQLRRRGSGISNRFVMFEAGSLALF